MYRRNRFNAGLNWFVVFLVIAITIGIVVYCANVPLGNILMDGLKAGMI